MSLKVATHLYRNRHGTFYFRLAVPSGLRSLVGRSEVRLSLGTEQRQAAIIAALPLIAGLPQLWADLRRMAEEQEALPPDYLQLWRTQVLRNEQLRMQIIQLKEQLEEKEEIIARMVARPHAELVVKQAYTSGQLKGKTQMEERLAFPWEPERTVTFTALLDAYMSHFSYRAAGGRKKPPGAKTLYQYRKDLEMFVAAMGDMHIGAVDREVAGQYFSILRRLPANMTRVAKFKGLTVAQILALRPAPVPQSEYNASKKMERASGMYKWALEEKRKWGIDANPFVGYGQSGETATSRRPFTVDELQLLLTGKAFVQKKFQRTYMFWLMPLALFTGARLGELCQLDIKDFVEVEGVPCIDINDIEAKELEVSEGGRKKTVKTKNARRLVPIHPELIRIGLLRYVDKLRRQRQTHLFPELSRTRRDGPAQAASNWFQRYRKSVGIDGKQETVFHSFRHLFITTLLDAGTSPHLVAPIVGHEAELVTGKVYWNIRDATKRLPTVQSFTLPSEILALFPAIEEVTLIENKDPGTKKKGVPNKHGQSKKAVP